MFAIVALHPRYRLAASQTSRLSKLEVRMHPALQSPHIFDLILKFVDVFPSNGELDDPIAVPSYTIKGNKTLAILARTCRMFRDPALNVLWHTIRDIKPLLRTFPAHLRVEDPPKAGEPSVYTLVSVTEIIECALPNSTSQST